MKNKKLFQQKKQAQLDEWSAELDKLKAKASNFSADAQLKANKLIKELKIKIEDGKKKLSELGSASEDSWESIKGGIETAWDSMKTAITDAVNKFKE